MFSSKKRLNSRGFSHVELILLIVFVAIIGSVGYYVSQNKNDTLAIINALSSHKNHLDYVSSRSTPTVPDGALTSASSPTWSGYAIDANSGQTFTTVSALFQIPTISCPAYAFNGTYHGATMWIGLDGLLPGGSNTVEQTGVADWCTGYNSSTGKQIPNYALWYETYPQKTVIIPLTVAAADTINTSVKYSGGDYTFTILDQSTGKSFTSTPLACGAASGCTRHTAEWIVEDNYADLGNFGTAVFHNAEAATTGASQPLGDFVSSNLTTKLTVGTSSAPLDVVGPIQPGGETFTIGWLAAL